VYPFDEIVGGMRVESSLYAHFLLTAPWGVHFHTADEARLLIVSRGGCWLIRGEESPVYLPSGTCMILKANVFFTLIDAPGRTAINCETLIDTHDGGLVEYGGGGEVTELVSGRFCFDPLAAEPLVALMPDIFHVEMDAVQAKLMQSTLDLMGLETAHAGVGAALVIDRLGDALFIQALRSFCFDRGTSSGSWIAGMEDGQLRRAIHAIHSDLARAWSVEEMAREAGMSRSRFAARFKELVGESPLDYLTGWRMYRARMLLSSSNESLVAIAEQVGYDSEVSFSRAFRRRLGTPPGQWRRDLRQTQAHRRDPRLGPHGPPRTVPELVTA
jgi:AraC-like DNA-binding protein